MNRWALRVVENGVVEIKGQGSYGGQHDWLLDDGLNSRSPNSGISLSRISCNVENNIPYFK
jgi:hypothetical protein